MLNRVSYFGALTSSCYATLVILITSAAYQLLWCKCSLKSFGAGDKHWM